MQNHKSVYFQYKFPATSNALMMAVGFALPLAFVYLATGNRKGLRLMRVVTLSPSQATVFYWSLAAIGLVIALLIVRFVVSRSGGPSTIQLGPVNALIPAATMSGTFISVPYIAIRRIDVQDIPGNNKMAIIHSTVGESRVMSSAFGSLSQFLTFVQTLKGRVPS